MQLVERFVRNPVKVSVAVVLVALFGGIAISRMPMQLTPEVEIPTLTIETRWPGASPAEIESDIIQPQEEQLQSVEGVTKMISECMDSQGRITLEFSVGTDMQEALLLTNTRLQQVPEYPQNVDMPVITAANSGSQWIAWFILNERTPTPEELRTFGKQHPHLAIELAAVARADNAGLAIYRLRDLAGRHAEARSLLPREQDLTTLRRFARNYIEARFENVDGVADSTVMGGREEELQVVIDPERLAARNLTIANVRDGLRSQNKDTSGGDFWEGKRRYVVRTLGQFRSPQDVEQVIIARRDGAPVYIRDVATVRLGYKKPDGLVHRYGHSVIAINASRKTGANVLQVMQGLRKAVDELNAGVLTERGLTLRQVYDETEYINASIHMVNDNIREGAVLTFIVLLIFLRSMRSTFVIFLSIAVSIVGMFLLMSLMGRSLNVLSLAGIAFAVGMLVDNFIVVLENIYRHYQSGEPPLAATVRGTREVWGAVLAATLANLAVFVPVLFVQDQAGQLFRDIALAASSALICSLLVALVVVPTAAARILRGQVSRDVRREASALEASRSLRAPRLLRRWWLLARGSPRSQAVLRMTAGAAALALLAYAAWTRDLAWVFAALGAVALVVPLDGFGRTFVKLVVGINAYLQQGVLRRIVVVAALIGVSLGLSYLLMPKREYLPNGNRNLVVGLLFPPPGYNLDHMAAMGRQVEARLKPFWDIAPGDPEEVHGDRPAIADLFYVARGRNLFLGLRALDPLRAAELVPVLRAAATDLPGVLVVANQRSLFESGLTAGRTIDIDITGPEITRLVGLGGQIMGRVMETVKVSVSGQKEMKLAQARPNPSLDLSNPEMHIIPKWQQAADMGVSAQELGYTVDALVDGAYAGDYFMGGDKIDISIIGQERFAARTQDLAALSLAVPSGELVSLAAVAEVRYASGPEQINHRRRQRAITIQVTPPPEMPLEDAMDIIRQQIIPPLEKAGQLSGGYQITLSGTADKLVQTWRVLGWNLALAVVITYLLMAALFESWLYPLVIILSVPLGAVGGFAGLRLLNLFYLQTLDVMTMLGFIILVGTVVNNPILIIEQALVHIRDEGMSPRRAVLESVRTRIRPIFMTALIGLFGLLPLVISPGAGSELYRGLGSVLLGGLLTSTVFTLVFVPTLFSLAMDARHVLVRRMFGAPAGKPHGAEQPHVAPVPQRAAARVTHGVQWQAADET